MPEPDLATVSAQRAVGYRRTSYAVWELTLKCNLKCGHCGSRAGDARAHELTTAEALDVVRQLAEVGITEVTLIGGEAYLRADWLDLAAAITRAGMLCTLTTGGLGLSLDTVRRMKAAGIARASVSVDGLADAHDRQRGVPGSFAAALRTLGFFQQVGLPASANSQLNRLSLPQLPALYEVLREAGVSSWQVAMTVPMGNAVEQRAWLLQPAELDAAFAVLARVARRAAREGVRVMAGNNVGYYGPHERLLRGHGRDGANVFWQGCGAGLASLGLEADGTVKGCPSLPTAAYSGGNVRDTPLAALLETDALRFNEGGGTEAGEAHLWGHCATCQYRRLCRGGCSWTAQVFFGRRGNNPYCHHRALTKASGGLRERVVLQQAAPGLPFDHGVFGLVEEPLGAPWPEDDLALHFTQAQWPPGWEAHP
jgi:radical SAM protein with 4Fe4S-binding SPASM domain